MKNLKFKKGEFITQNTCPDSFAIFGGVPYESLNPEDGADYSLICYFNPDHYEQNSNGQWYRESVFEYELNDEESCEYTISESDMQYWRSCTQYEIIQALKTLAGKRLAWDDAKHILRRLSPNEQIKFDDNHSTVHCGGNTRHSSPMYSQTKTTIKQITRVVNEAWEQKEPMTAMDDERRIFVLAQCDKLKYAFTDYNYGSQRVYPQNGYDYPRRFGGMCGINAYNDLMNGDDWGCYE